MDGVELTFDVEALDYIVDMAIEYKLGARGLRSILERAMTDIMYEVPSRDDVLSVEITPECIRGTGKPIYHLINE